ncbi:MAG: zinc-dependent alcohol dehydrogenase [Planctomycetota bacterium]|jgi:L-iditol 2-dehydrogenase
MKAMMLTGIRAMEMRELPDPKIVNPTDVLIRMKALGVCGSDVHYYTTGKIGSQVVEYPFPVGHEGAGVVEAVGDAVTRVKPGDRIAIEPAVSCFECDQCKAGRPHTCRTLTFLGCPGQISGCLSELLVMPEACCFPIPDSMSMTEAAISEPLAIGVYAVKQSIPMADAKVGILGAGPIGLSVLLPALAGGAETVYMTDKLDYRLKVARAQGAHWTGNPESTDVVADILAAEPGALDVVFECCGQQEALDQAIQLLKPGGKLMLIGIPTVDRISFSIDLLRRREICIQNVRRQNHCVQPALDAITNGDFQVEFMATHRFPFDQTQAAFDLVDEYGDGVVKAMVDF